MKITLLKWKYVIIKEGRPANKCDPWWVITKVPYGLLSLFVSSKFIDTEYTEEDAIKRVENMINRKIIKPEVVKEYYL